MKITVGQKASGKQCNSKCCLQNDGHLVQTSHSHYFQTRVVGGPSGWSPIDDTPQLLNHSHAGHCRLVQHVTTIMMTSWHRRSPTLTKGCKPVRGCLFSIAWANSSRNGRVTNDLRPHHAYMTTLYLPKYASGSCIAVFNSGLIDWCWFQHCQWNVSR